MWLYYRFLDYRSVISSFFFPRQKWLTKIIPNTWCDKTELIPRILYECLKHYVEKEKCFETVDWDHHIAYKDVARDIKECYKWITEDRPKLQAEIDRIINDGFEGIDSLMRELQSPTKTYDERYPNLTNLELELENKDTYYLTLIVKHRGYLWT